MRIWVIFWASIALAAILAFVVRTQGYVSGQEFAPTHFLTRDFSFYEIPILHIQITPIRRIGGSQPTINHIRQNLLTVPKGTPTDEQWQLVRLSRGLSGNTSADPNLLMDQLGKSSGQDYFWRKWSIDHPQHAGIVWPIVQRLSLRELYILVPAVLQIAREDLSPAEMTAKLDELLIDEYASLISDMRQAGRNELADSLLTEALVDYPGAENLSALSKQP